MQIEWYFKQEEQLAATSSKKKNVLPVYKPGG